MAAVSGKPAPPDFVDALTRIYLARPGAVLPNALWKTRAIVARCQTQVAVAADGITPTRLLLTQPGKLFLYWDRDHRLDLPPGLPETLTFALLHERYLPGVDLGPFPLREHYFRLVYEHRAAESGLVKPLPAGFSTAPVGISEAPGPAASQVSRFIGQCYDDLQPSAGTVEGWRYHPSFHPDLWLWLVDRQRAQPAALGIAEYDELVGEGSLEWIQVLPAYQRRGLGTTLVAELLERLAALGARFTTVAGRLDNPAQPEALYRRCGFTGTDRWWLLRR
jgi:ribosomal protein S18 acetylase RimI-like enzyme